MMVRPPLPASVADLHTLSSGYVSVYWTPEAYQVDGVREGEVDGRGLLSVSNLDHSTARTYTLAIVAQDGAVLGAGKPVLGEPKEIWIIVGSDTERLALAQKTVVVPGGATAMLAFEAKGLAGLSTLSQDPQNLGVRAIVTEETEQGAPATALPTLQVDYGYATWNEKLNDLISTYSRVMLDHFRETTTKVAAPPTHTKP